MATESETFYGTFVFYGTCSAILNILKSDKYRLKETSCIKTQRYSLKTVRFCKKIRTKAKYLPHGLKHKEKRHGSIMGPRNLRPRALRVYPGPFYCFLRGIRPFVSVKKWFEALTGEFLPFLLSHISNGVCEI